MEWEKLLSKERFYQSGDGEEPGRSDYDTIIRSTLFRRLQDKAQVLPLESDDYVRTRLTHSLEVSAIGKRQGKTPGLSITRRLNFRIRFCVPDWFTILGIRRLVILVNMLSGSGFSGI